MTILPISKYSYFFVLFFYLCSIFFLNLSTVLYPHLWWSCLVYVPASKCEKTLKGGWGRWILLVKMTKDNVGQIPTRLWPHLNWLANSSHRHHFFCGSLIDADTCPSFTGLIYSVSLNFSFQAVVVQLEEEGVRWQFFSPPAAQSTTLNVKVFATISIGTFVKVGGFSSDWGKTNSVENCPIYTAIFEVLQMPWKSDGLPSSLMS